MNATEQREDIAVKLLNLSHQLQDGCGSRNCQINPVGKLSWGPCRCRPGKLAMDLLAISEELQEIVTWKDAAQSTKTPTLTP